MYKQLKNKAILLLVWGAIGTVSGQAVLKVGVDPYSYNEKAALDIQSTTKGLLPPRMTQAQRDAIANPPSGLLVWCTDCNKLTDPVSGELCIYLGNRWSSFAFFSRYSLTTGKKADANAPERIDATSATINGVLASVTGGAPAETGVVWREIIGTDFATLPVLDGAGMATAPTYKTPTAQPVTTSGAPISVTIPSLTSSTSFTRPYYFRAYAKSGWDISYGNPVIFNCAPPVISTPVVTGEGTQFPASSATLRVNAGTPKGTITEYGYCSSTTANPTTANNKVVLSTAVTLAALDERLDSETFTSDPTVDLAVTNYNAVLGTTYFRYYVVANGVTTYSQEATFETTDPVADGTAIAIVSIEPMSGALRIGVPSTAFFKVNFMVTRAGTYSFVPSATTGGTTGIFIDNNVSGSFALGAQSLIFSVTGTPATSLAGNSFVIPGLGTLSTGAIDRANLIANNAICAAIYETTIVPITIITANGARVWMDRNLGASRAATSPTDHEAYGCMYQWGRGNDGHTSVSWDSATSGTAVNGTKKVLANTDSPGGEFILSPTMFDFDWRSPKNDNLWQGVTGVNNPCPSGYRVPTIVEFEEVLPIIAGGSTAAFNSGMLFVLPGIRERLQGRFVAAGQLGVYWASNSGAIISISNGTTEISNQGPIIGSSVRCIKD